MKKVVFFCAVFYIACVLFAGESRKDDAGNAVPVTRATITKKLVTKAHDTGEAVSKASEKVTNAIAETYDIVYRNKNGKPEIGHDLLPVAKMSDIVKTKHVVAYHTKGTDAKYGFDQTTLAKEILDKFTVAPSLVADSYDITGGVGKGITSPADLGAGSNVAYKLDNNDKLGVNFDHVISTGIYGRTPDADSVMFTYSFSVK